MGHAFDDEPMFDGDGILHVVDRFIKSPAKPHESELYSADAIQFHRAQALYEVMHTFFDGYSRITKWEQRLLKGEDVKVKTSDVQPVLGLKQHASVFQLLSGFQSLNTKYKVWRWKDIRATVIIRFSQVVFHNYLAALE